MLCYVMLCYAFISAWFIQWNDAMLFEYMQWVNAKCIAFSFFFVNFPNLYWGFSNLTPFSLLLLWSAWFFSKTQLPFLEVINIIYFSFYYLPSIRVSSYSKLSISWVIIILSALFQGFQNVRISSDTKHFIPWLSLVFQWFLYLLKKFSSFFESFHIFRVHDASSLRTLTPFVF